MGSNVILSSNARTGAVLRKAVSLAAVVFLLVGASSAQAAKKLSNMVVKTVVGQDGGELDLIQVPGSPPPKGPRPAAVTLPKGIQPQGATGLSVPAFTWTYGCSATSAGMMFGYYDRNGFVRMYTGPVNNGVCPLTNYVWGESVYPSTTCGNCPIVATKKGVDARTTRGHVDDYWYDYGSEIDPYYTGKWTQHSPLDCAADFMGTNQFQNWESKDGSTWFSYKPNGSPNYDPAIESYGYRDGCRGMRLFVESLGYSVASSGNFNQYCDVYMGDGTGFTFAQYMGEVAAGRPVLIQVDGHTMLGVGYDETSKTVYLHDTWDYKTHEMTWGGSYSGMKQVGVTVFRLEGFDPPTPGTLAVSPSKLSVASAVGTSPANQTFNLWSTSTDNIDYTISVSSSAQSWLSCTPVSGTATSSASAITVSYSTAALAAGSYSGTITVASQTDSSVTAAVAVALTVWDPSSIPSLEVSTSALSAKTTVGTNPAALSFTLNASSDTIDYAISSSHSWVSTSPLYGTATTAKQTVTVNFNAAGITNTGVYTAVLTLKPSSSSIETKYVTVTLSVGALLAVAPTKLTPSCGLETTATPQTFQVWNSGVGDVSFTISADDGGAGWLSCAETSGFSSGPADIQTVHVSYATKSLAAKVYTGKITLTDTNNSENNKTVTVILTVSDGPAVITSVASVDLNKSASFSLHNSGGGAVSFEVSDNASWFWCSPMTGTLESGADPLAVTVNYDTALPLGTYTGVVTVTGRDASGDIVFNSPLDIPVSIEVGGGPGPSDGEIVSSVNNLNNSATFGANASSQIFQLTNSSPATTRYFAISVANGTGGSWCAVKPNSGALTAASPQASVTVSYQSSALAVGSYTATLSIAETNSSGVVLADVPVKTVAVSLSVVEQPNLSLMLSADSMKAVAAIGANPASQTFQVWSLGGAVNFAVSYSEFWLSCSPVSGTSNGETHDIVITYSASTLAEGTYKATIKVAPRESGSIVAPQYLTVTLVVGNGYSAPTLVDGIAFACSAGGAGVTTSTNGAVSFVPDLTANITGASQRGASRQPLLLAKAINSLPVLDFDGHDRLDLPQGDAINAAGPYTEKTLGVVFKTGQDIWSKQILFEQGDKNSGFNLYIEGSYLFVGAWNLKNSSQIATWGPVFLCKPLLTNTAYGAIMLYDQSANSFKAYLNGSLIGESSQAGVIAGGKSSAFIGGKGKGGVYYTSGQPGGFKGQIAEVWYYNVALGDTDFTQLNDYFTGKYALNLSPMPLPENGLAEWFRAYDDVNLSTTGNVCLWKDSAGSTNQFAQNKKSAMPAYNASFGGQFPAIVFDGVATRLDSKLKTTNLSAMTLFLAFTTSANAATRQVIWAWGDKNCGMNVYLEGNNVYLGCWSLKGKYAWGQKFLNAPVKANTAYCVEMDFNANTNTFKGAVNGVGITAVNDVYSLDLKDMSLGGVIRSSYFHNDAPGGEAYFTGALMEMINYNATLDASQTLQVQSYLGDRYSISFPK